MHNQNQVRNRDVKLGRDFGERVDGLSGLEAGQRVIVYPGDGLREGTTIVPAVIAMNWRRSYSVGPRRTSDIVRCRDMHGARTRQAFTGTS